MIARATAVSGSVYSTTSSNRRASAEFEYFHMVRSKFSDDLKRAYQGFNLDIPALNGTPGEWALPVSATYVIDRDGTIIHAYTDVDYRDRADPNDVLQVPSKKAVAA